jgi:DNA-binding transcriptional LysR family regulator
MASEVIGRDQLLVVVSPEHPWAQRTDGVSGQELAATEIIIRESGSGTREILEAALEPWGGVRARLELGATSAILGAARRGEGPAVLSALAVADDVEAGKLVVVNTTGIDLTRSFRAVWSSELPMVPLVRRLLGIATT